MVAISSSAREGKEYVQVDENPGYKILRVYKICSQDCKTAAGPRKTKIKTKGQRIGRNCDLYQICFTDSGQNVKTIFM